MTRNDVTRFLWVRHATAGDGRSISGRTSVPLDTEGEREASRLAERLRSLPVTHVYCSPLERTRRTAEVLAGALGAPLRQEGNLLELGFGEWTGAGFDELERSERWRQFNDFRSGTRIPEGELMLEAQVRAVRLALSLRERHEGEWLVLVTHADVIRAVIAHFLGIPVDLALRLEIAHASVSVLDLGRWSARLVRLNDVGPMSADLPLSRI